MFQFKVYFQNFPEPLLVTATDFGEAEKSAVRSEPLKQVSRIEKVGT